MESSPHPDIDNDFTQLYKEYTPPLVCNASNVPDKAKTNKRSHASCDEDEELRDPNAIPTDFTSREAKLWEAKSKASERNWKKRKEEELICKICGQSGHFTQGCPSTLGANLKSRVFLERVSAREKHVKDFFTEEVIHKIEKDIGCKVKVEEKCIVISGKDRLILSKGVNAVRKAKEEGEREHFDSQMRRSISPEKSSVGPQFERSDSQRSYPSPRNTSQFLQGFGRHDKVVEDHVREDFREMARASSRGFANDGARGCSSHLKSSAHPPQRSSSYNSSDGHRHHQNVEHYKSDGMDAERQGSRKYTLEELEWECEREAIGLERIREKQEEEERKKHQEVAREMREMYLEKLAGLRGAHSKQREEFHLLQRRLKKQARHGISTSGYGGNYRQSSSYSESADHYAEANVAMGTKEDRYPDPMANYVTLRPHETYLNFRQQQQQQRQRGDDYGKASDRY